MSKRLIERFRYSRQFLTSLFFLFLITGCVQELTLEVPVGQNETLAKNDVVYLNGAPAGKIERLITVNGGRAAIISIDSRQEEFRTGIYRDSEDNRINLRGNKVDSQSPPLTSGTRIPREAGLPPAIRVFANDQTLLLAGIAIVALLVVIYAFKFFFKFSLIVFAFVLAGMLSWVSYPYLLPHVQDLYAQVPIEELTSSPEIQNNVVVDVVEDITGLSGVSNGVMQVLVNRPDPKWMSFSILLLLYFVLVTLLLGKATRSISSD